MSTLLSRYLPKIHDRQRRVFKSSTFGYKTSIVSLDFLGMDNHYITEYGQIWSRDKILSNNEGFVTKGFIPHVQIENHKYPWVLLPIPGNKVWTPINLLLGWAFKPTTDQYERYFNFDDSDFISGMTTQAEGKWSIASDSDGVKYNDFINRLYSNN